MTRYDYIDDDGQMFFETAAARVRADLTGQSRHRRIHLSEVSTSMSLKAARQLGQALLAAADAAEKGATS